MTDLKKQVCIRLYGAVKEAFPECDITEKEFEQMLEYPPDASMGDLALPCFKLSKKLRKPPVVISNEISAKIKTDNVIKKCSTVSGYLNFKISDKYYTDFILDKILDEKDDYGKINVGCGKKLVIDYSSPNVAKPFHIGHLGSTVIGHSIKLIHQFAGWDAIGVNHLGDWGTQFGKMITAYRLWNDESDDNESVDKLVSLYVRFHKEAENDPSLIDKAREEFAKLERGDEENIQLWKKFVGISIKEYEKTYRQLGIKFDYYTGESFYTDLMPEQINKLREKELLKIDDGASIVDLSEYGMPPCLILKKDGTTLYPTRDIAAAVYRKRTFDFDKCIYVTSNQQILHFKQWFRVMDLMGYDWYDQLVHVPYGTVSINGEKLATRSGNVILLKDLFKKSIDKVSEIIESKNPGLENKDEIAEAVGVGAVVFYYLSNSRIKDSDFNLDDALSFEGNTGPYAQYTYARACSIIEKASGNDDTFDTSGYTPADVEVKLLKTLSLFSENIENALDEYEPMFITRYILDVAADFNKFYHDCKILSEENEKAKQFRIKLTKAVKIVLGNAFGLICLKKTPKI